MAVERTEKPERTEPPAHSIHADSHQSIIRFHPVIIPRELENEMGLWNLFVFRSSWLDYTLGNGGDCPACAAYTQLAL